MARFPPRIPAAQAVIVVCPGGFLMNKKATREQNPKSEFRNPKQPARQNKSRFRKFKTSNPLWVRLEFVVFGSLEFVSDFVLRVFSFSTLAPLRLCAR
jgi:hypothetical protein